MIMEYGHQGDVFFKEVHQDVLNDNIKPIPNKCLALGEISGHAHAVVGDEVQLYEHGNITYVRVGPKGAHLIHTQEQLLIKNDFQPIAYPKEDHETIILSPNKWYQFGLHQRYNPFTTKLENVHD